MAKGKDALTPVAAPGSGASTKAKAKDYSGASPEEIMADIERTRARMDATLSQMNQRLKRRVPGKAVGIALGILAAGLLGALGFAGVKALRHRKSKPLLRSTWRQARLIEQGVLAAKLAMAARKGKPAIIVVEPRKV